MTRIVVTIEARRNYLVSEPNVFSFIQQNFLWNLISHRKGKKKHTHTQIFNNELVYLGLPILEISRIVMYEFWYDYVETTSEENKKLCYMDTGIFIVYNKIENIYSDIAKDVETRFDISNYELDRSLPTGKIRKYLI